MNVQSATNLPVREETGKLSPIVVVKFLGKSIETEAAIGRHANWQFSGVLPVEHEDELTRLAAHVELIIYDQLISPLDKDDREVNTIHEQVLRRYHKFR